MNASGQPSVCARRSGGEPAPGTAQRAHMYLKHISLTNFRNFTRLDIDIPQRVVLLTGANAQGKTSVLEAIYFLAAFTSFQTHTDRQTDQLHRRQKKFAGGCAAGCRISTW